MTSPCYQPIRRYAFGDMLREHRRSRPHRPALVDGAVRLTYAALDAEANRLATALAARGLGAGGRMIWLGQNAAHIVVALAAAAKLGATLCPANWRLTPSETLRLIDDFDPRVVFWQEHGFADTHHFSAHIDRGDRLWVRADGTGADGYAALVAEGEDRDDEAPVDADAPLLAIFTAAFDGRPNAAMLSHNAVLLQGLLSAQNQAIDAASVNLVSGPMFHLGVLMGMFGTMVVGGTNLFVPRIEPLEMLAVIDAERPTHAFIPKPVVDAMRAANADGRFDVSSLFADPAMADWTTTSVLPASAPRRRFPGGYGQTEIMGLVCHAGPDGAGARPSPFLQIRLLDEEGGEVPTGTVGEIAARGPLVMAGYHDRDAENARRARDGWHRTNDLGIRREDGSIAFVGPKATMIKTGVENVYPQEVEACLRLHPAVADACVIGVPDPKWDQNVKALIELNEGTIAGEDELIAHCRLHIASYKKPKLFAFVERLPRTEDGRIDRAAADRDHGGGGYPSYAV